MLRTTPPRRTLKPKERKEVLVWKLLLGMLSAPGSSPGRIWRHTLSMEGEKNRMGMLWAVETTGAQRAGCNSSHTPQKMPAASQLPALSVPPRTAVSNRDPHTLIKSISTAQSGDTELPTPCSQATSRWQNEKNKNQCLEGSTSTLRFMSPIKQTDL